MHGYVPSLDHVVADTVSTVLILSHFADCALNCIDSNFNATKSSLQVFGFTCKSPSLIFHSIWGHYVCLKHDSVFFQLCKPCTFCYFPVHRSPSIQRISIPPFTAIPAWETVTDRNLKHYMPVCLSLERSSGILTVG